MYVALWSLMNSSTSIVPESKTVQASETITGSINVDELIVTLVGSLSTYLKLKIVKQSFIWLLELSGFAAYK